MTVGWFLKALTQYADFKGRARRREYWWFMLIAYLVIIAVASFTAVTVASAVDGASLETDQVGIVGWFMLALTAFVALWLLIPYWAVTVRRLHDSGKSTWWVVFLFFLPVVIWILALLDSERGDNRYGPDPKASERVDGGLT